jgi:alpha-galactosidase
VRFEVMLHLGAFVTESSGHFSEYVPYFRKRPDLVKKYTRSGYLGESGFYANNWPRWRRESDESIEAMLRGDKPVPLERSLEYGADIIEAIECGRPASIHGNVLNDGSIENVPQGCVEVECHVDRDGIKAKHFGTLPEQLAALNRAHMAVHELLVEALFERSKQKAKYALMLDPLTAAVCSPNDIDGLFEEMWAAERESLPPFD